MAKAKWPTVWLVTDERMGDLLWPALARLPTGAGILFRHYDCPDRAALARGIAALAARHGQFLAVAGDVALARAVRAVLVHKPQTDPADLPFSLPVHSLAAADVANARGASLAFVSPVFATRSHQGKPALGTEEAAAIVRRLKCPAIALGGMTARRFADRASSGFHGWAAIDAWL